MIFQSVGGWQTWSRGASENKITISKGFTDHHRSDSSSSAQYLILIMKVDALSSLSSTIFPMRGSTMHNGFVLFVLCVLLTGGFPTLSGGDEGSNFLDSKEQDVDQLASIYIINAGQQCELLATCDNPTNCSHDACSLENTGGFQCMSVANNKFCSIHGTTNTSCKKMNLDYGRSCVRLAATTNLKSVDTMLSICATRGLEPLFKTLANPTTSSRAYIATMDGSFRIYPGTLQDADGCRAYDPRIRPWFRTATSVEKIVVVLIDLSASMGNNLPPDLGAGTILQAAKNMVKQLLNTLSAQDYVNIILYDSSRVIQLSNSTVLVQEDNSMGPSDLDSLRTELDKYTVEGQNRQSNLSAAILAALPNFDSNSQAAKVIIVITDGVFSTIGANVTLPVVEVSDLRIKLFMYKLHQPNDKDIFLKDNSMVQQLCSVGGHFEPILKNLDNPLLAFQGYFTYLAYLKEILTNGRPQYSQMYRSFETTFGDMIISVSKLVVYKGHLIGVAVIDIDIEALGRITDQVKQALMYRTTAYGLAAPDVVLDAANCSLVNETIQPCGSSTAYFAQNGGLCARADPPKSTIQELMCCENCSAPPGPSETEDERKKKRMNKQIIIGCIVGGLVVILAVYLTVKCIRRRRSAHGGSIRINGQVGAGNELVPTNCMLTAALAFYERQVHEFDSLRRPGHMIFEGLCTDVVNTLLPAARNNFQRYRRILVQLNQDPPSNEEGGGLHNSVSFCLESLIGSAQCFQRVAELLKKCGRPEWYKSALELANLPPSDDNIKRWSEFSLAIRNCEWALDILELAFHILEIRLRRPAVANPLERNPFQWSAEKGRMVLKIQDEAVQRQNDIQAEHVNLPDHFRELENEDLTNLKIALTDLAGAGGPRHQDSSCAHGIANYFSKTALTKVVKELAVCCRSRHQGSSSSAHAIASYLSNKLEGPIPQQRANLPPSWEIQSDAINFKRHLGRGTYGLVDECEWNNIRVAVKSVSCRTDQGINKMWFEREAAILGMVQHPNVVRLIGEGFKRPETGLLVMELMEHDLRTIIESPLRSELPAGSNTPFSPSVAIDLMLQIAEAMWYLERHEIFHRDLKAKNILVNLCKPLDLSLVDQSNFAHLIRLPYTQEIHYLVKLADFGLAKWPPGSSSASTYCNVGTPGWRAPEVFELPRLEADEKYTLSADVYSYGMTCYEILTGQTPFANEAVTRRGNVLHDYIMEGNRPSLEDLEPAVPESLRELIRHCWTTNAEGRPSFEEIVRRLWECKSQVVLGRLDPGLTRPQTREVINGELR